MKFKIKRTSLPLWDDYYIKSKPHPDAIQERFTRLNRKCCESLDLAKDTVWGDEFFRHGTNHREENGMVVRDMEEVLVWTIEIDNIMDFVMALDEDIVISKVDYLKGLNYEIEIYDDYRE